ncbi:MAG: MBL fold metallo-hydrolase [Candidatus Heimdallarchaeaceae archaeon]
MVDYGAISVVIFKVKNNQPYFYLVKRSSDMPIFPDTWTPIAGTITKADHEVYLFLYNKLGNIIDDMSSRLTAVRLMLERNLLSPFEEEQANKTEQDVYERIKNLDPDLLSVYLHSMIPSGFEKINDGENTFSVKQYIFISSGSSIFERLNLINKSTIYINPTYELETKSRWFSAKQIKKFYDKSTKLFLPSFTFLIHLITDKGMKLIGAARRLVNVLETNESVNYQILPFIWRYMTPALTLPPFHTTNIYVIGDEIKYIIDPGANSVSDIVNLLSFIDDHINEIEGIILTSANADHCNQVLELKERYNFPICASHKISEFMKKQGCVINHELKEGDRIPLGSYKSTGESNWFLEVVDLPGNSPGCIGLWDSRGIIFTGSALHKTLINTPGPYPHSFDDLFGSLNKLKKYRARFGLSGHGNIIADVNVSISLNIKRMKWSEKSILKHLKTGVSRIDEIAEELIDKELPQWKRMTRNTIEATLNKLVFQEKVIRRGDDYLLSK